MKVLFTLLLLLIVPGSINAQEIFKGHYVSAFERKIFSPCGVDDVWWLDGKKHSVYSDLEKFIKKNSLRSGKSDLKPNKPVYIKVAGTKSEKGKWGHRGLYQYQLKVTKIIDISVADKCLPE